MAILENGARFTVYDAMEAAGMFRSNPANANSRDATGKSLFKGPVKFPMMMYHPKGTEHILAVGTIVRYPGAPPEKFNEQWELDSKQVNSEEELSEAIADGWYKFPAFAIKAANESWRKEQGLAPLPVPAISAQSRIDELEETNKRLSDMLEEAKRNKADIEGGEFVPLPKAGSASSSVTKAGLV